MDGHYTIQQIDMVIDKLLPLLQKKREIQPGQQVDYRIPGRIVMQ